MLKRHDIQVLLKAGQLASRGRGAHRGVDPIAKAVAKEDAVTPVDDVAARMARGIDRPSLVEDFRKPILGLFEHEPDLRSVEVLRRMRLAGYEGQKTALFALIAAVRPEDQAPLVRFRGLPGEFSQHDFGHMDVEYVDAATQRIRFFASRLKYSRTIRVSPRDLQPESTQFAHRGVTRLAARISMWFRPAGLIFASGPFQAERRCFNAKSGNASNDPPTRHD